MVIYQLARFGGDRHCGSRDIKLLVFHMILKNHMITGSCDILGRKIEVTSLPSLGAIRIVEVEVCF